MSAIMAIVAGGWQFLKGLPREVWYALAIALALWWLVDWHRDTVTAAALAARQDQARIDTEAVREMQDAATARQDALRERLSTKQATITERTDHAITNAVAAIDRAAADKRMRHEADADRRRAREGAATAIPETAGGDREAYCATAGWIPFGRALNMATDAEKDATQARECAAWVTEQAKAWPE